MLNAACLPTAVGISARCESILHSASAGYLGGVGQPLCLQLQRFLAFLEQLLEPSIQLVEPRQHLILPSLDFEVGIDVWKRLRHG